MSEPNSREELKGRVSELIEVTLKHHDHECRVQDLDVEPFMQLFDQYLTNQLEKAVVEAKLDENGWSRQQMIARNAFGENNWAIKLFNDRKLKLLQSTTNKERDGE